MAFHRFVVTVEVTVAAPGASDEAATPADPSFADDVAKAVQKDTAGKTKAKKGSTEYTVEKVKKV
jgi:hypothetical protein